MKSSKSHLKTRQIKDLDAIVKYVSGKAKFDVYEAYSVLKDFSDLVTYVSGEAPTRFSVTDADSILERLRASFYLAADEVKCIKYAIDMQYTGHGGDDVAVYDVKRVVRALESDPNRVRR